MPPLRFICHSKTAIDIALRYGWKAGARYTNLRDVKHLPRVEFIDIEWRDYDFNRHLSVVRSVEPCFTVAQDIVKSSMFGRVMDQAHELARYACNVIIVPKATKLGPMLDELVPRTFLLGYSVPTQYGGTRIAPRHFKRGVHLLGGRPDAQRRLANQMQVVSADGNRFTLDAGFGDYFDGERFRPHPVGGYRRCLTDSVRRINKLWNDYPSYPIPCRCGLTTERRV